MSDTVASPAYALDNDEEPLRLDRQARLYGIDRVLRRFADPNVYFHCTLCYVSGTVDRCQSVGARPPSESESRTGSSSPRLQGD